MITYRPEIDGLRALAVMAVLFYHTGLKSISGGYVGVDIFFVISGFLITSIIYAELKDGRFSFKNFWLRRARRILPAAFVVMAATVVAFAFIYPDDFYHDIGKSLAAQSLFSANIYFWKESGYFEGAAELKPFLHTWSLAVEEQFYFLFPFLLWLVFTSFRVALLPVFIIFSVVSLGISVWGSVNYPNAAFYLLPARAWELGVGAVLALISPRFFSSNSVINNITAVIGLSMIVIALVTFDDNTSFPSYNAALPVFGTVAIIWANTNARTVLGRFFSLRPVVGIGLISYSLYLWHWPVILFSNWVFAPEAGLGYSFILLLISMILATLSYKFVEIPIKINRAYFTNKRLVTGSLVASVFAFATGIGISIVGNSQLVDSDGSIDAYYRTAMEENPEITACSDRIHVDSISVAPCKYTGNPSSKTIDIFVWGDSHGGSLMPAFEKLAKEYGYNIEYAIRDGCQPIIGMRKADSDFRCQEYNNLALTAIESSNPELVVLVASFVNNILVGKIRDINSDYTVDPSQSLKEFKIRIAETVTLIKATGAKAVVFTEPPRLSQNPVTEYVRQQILGLKIDDNYAERNSHNARIKKVYRIIDETNIDLRLDYTDYFCDESKCSSQRNGYSLYRDASHISKFGAMSLAPFIRNDLERLLER